MPPKGKSRNGNAGDRNWTGDAQRRVSLYVFTGADYPSHHASRRKARWRLQPKREKRPSSTRSVAKVRRKPSADTMLVRDARRRALNRWFEN
jgi:hypothetical protein